MTDQQETALNPRALGDRGPDPRRRGMELARADVRRRMEAAPAGPLRDTLQRALDDLEQRLTRLAAEPDQE